MPHSDSSRLVVAAFVIVSWFLLARLLNNLANTVMDKLADEVKRAHVPAIVAPSNGARSRSLTPLQVAVATLLANIGFGMVLYAIQNRSASLVTLFYAAVATVSTVGFGDLVLVDDQSSDAWLLVASVYVIASVFATGYCVSRIVVLLNARRQRDIVRRVAREQISPEQLADGDLDQDGKLSGTFEIVILCLCLSTTTRSAHTTLFTIAHCSREEAEFVLVKLKALSILDEVTLTELRDAHKAKIKSN